MSLSETQKIEFSRDLANRVISELEDKKREEKGQVSLSDLSNHFLACYLGIIVYRALSENPKVKMSKENLYKYTYKNFSQIKEDVQNSVAAAFQGAMSTFSGKNVEYYCQINMIPPPVNKTPC